MVKTKKGQPKKAVSSLLIKTVVLSITALTGTVLAIRADYVAEDCELVKLHKAEDPMSSIRSPDEKPDRILALCPP